MGLYDRSSSSGSKCRRWEVLLVVDRVAANELSMDANSSARLIRAVSQLCQLTNLLISDKHVRSIGSSSSSDSRTTTTISSSSRSSVRLDRHLEIGLVFKVILNCNRSRNGSNSNRGSNRGSKSRNSFNSVCIVVAIAYN